MLFKEKNNLGIKSQKETLKKLKIYENKKPKEKENQNEDKTNIHKFELNKDSKLSDNIIEEDKEIKLCSFYIKKLSEKVLLQYGRYFLKSFSLKENDNISLPENFMKNHKISPYMRTKMVNWMLEIFDTFRSNEETFLAAVDIMDKFIFKYKKNILKDENIHLIGILCIYIASKVYDLIPIQLDNIIHQIGHDQFSQKEILIMERTIIKTLNFDVFSLNSFDLIRFLIYDFYINNKGVFKALKAEKYMDMLTNCSIWIYKLCKHFSQYSPVKPLILSIACLLIGYDFIRDNCEDFIGEVKDFFKEWLSFLFNKIGKKKGIKDNIEAIYKKIQKSYNDYKDSSFHNLIHYHELYFE